MKQRREVARHRQRHPHQRSHLPRPNRPLRRRRRPTHRSPLTTRPPLPLHTQKSAPAHRGTPPTHTRNGTRKVPAIGTKTRTASGTRAVGVRRATRVPSGQGMGTQTRSASVSEGGMGMGRSGKVSAWPSRGARRARLCSRRSSGTVGGAISCGRHGRTIAGRVVRYVDVFALHFLYFVSSFSILRIIYLGASFVAFIDVSGMRQSGRGSMPRRFRSGDSNTGPKGLLFSPLKHSLGYLGTAGTGSVRSVFLSAPSGVITPS